MEEKKISEYESTLNAIIIEVEEQKKLIENKKPNKNSKFLSALDKVRQIHGGIRFLNIYTGDSIKVSHKNYRDSLKLYAQDIEEDNCLFALAEVSHNTIGIRVYFEFDYRSFIRLPTEDEMIEHIKLTQNLIRESFPKHDSVYCLVAKCTRKLKKAKSDPNGQLKLAIGLHIVFPNIVVDTLTLRQLNLTLDARISSHNLFFAGVVDPASIHTEDATLRPLYAYRMDQCEGCYPTRAKLSQKKKLTKKSGYLKNLEEWNHDKQKLNMEPDNEVDYDSDSEEDLPPLDEMIKCAQGCFKGKKIPSPSIYKPWLIFSYEGEISGDEKTMSIEEWILDMSIVPEVTQSNDLGLYQPVSDAIYAYTPHTRAQVSVYKNELHIMHQKEHAKNTAYISHQQKPSVFNIVKEILRNVHPIYKDILPDKISFNPVTKTLSITVRGKLFNHCLLKNTTHNNRILFNIRLKKKEVILGCFKKECAAKYRAFYNWLHPSKKSIDNTESKLDPNELKNVKTANLKIEDHLIRGLREALGLTSTNQPIIHQAQDHHYASFPSNIRERKEDGTEVEVKLIYDPLYCVWVLPEQKGSNKRLKPEEINPNYYDVNEAKQKEAKKIKRITIPESTIHPKVALKAHLDRLKLLAEKKKNSS